MTSGGRNCFRNLAVIAATVAALTLAAAGSASAQRVLGIDVSAWQGDLSSNTWQNMYNGGRQFAFIRSSRGGTTGYDHRRGGYPSTNNDAFALSERYDDPYFIQNINRATAAGMFASAYHFGRADVSGNTGTDEATHFIQQAGAFMRPGYLLPVFDLEAGSGLSQSSLSSWSVAFADTIRNFAGVAPIIYANSSYVNDEVNSSVAAAMPHLWIARPSSGDPLTTEPPAHSVYPNVYGKWNPLYPTIPNPQPWQFWQYSTTGGIPGYGSNIDKNAANGGIEFVKDFLVPALWVSNSSGDWEELAKWNSGQTPTPPPGPPTVPSCGTCRVGTGQLTPIGDQTLPTPRLPGAAGSGVTSGQHDTVILERPNANITVTHSSGTHSVRKLIVREGLSITGGSLSVTFDPADWDSPHKPNWFNHGPNETINVSAQFSEAVSMSGGNFSVPTLRVDATETFTLSGGNLTFDTINLMPHGSSPAAIAMHGNVTFSPLGNGPATIANGAGAGSSGRVDLGGGNRDFHVANGAAAVDLAVNVPIVNGGLTKSGPGTMLLGGANTFSGPVQVNGGTLRLGHSSGLSSSSVVTLDISGVLDMNGVHDTIAGLSSGFTATGVLQQGSANLTLAGDSGFHIYGGSITGTGTLTKSGAATQVLSGNKSFGAVDVSSGSLLLYGHTTADAVTVFGGTLDAAGTITGPVTVHSGGWLATGSGLGALDLGGLTLNPGSILDIDLGAPAESDLFDVAGQLTLNGGLVKINDAGGMAPGTYTIIDYTSLSGSVASLSPFGPNGFDYSLVDTGSAINLVVSAIGIPGDFNNDDIVDGGDYVVWSKNRGTSNELSNDGGIGGTVGDAHYHLWMQNFGNSLEGSGSGQQGAVPEPTSTVAALLAIAACLARRRSR